MKITARSKPALTVNCRRKIGNAVCTVTPVPHGLIPNAPNTKAEDHELSLKLGSCQLACNVFAAFQVTSIWMFVCVPSAYFKINLPISPAALADVPPLLAAIARVFAPNCNCVMTVKELAAV